LSTVKRRLESYSIGTINRLSPDQVAQLLNNIPDNAAFKLDHLLNVAFSRGKLLTCSITPKFMHHKWLETLYRAKQNLTWLWSPSFGSVGGNAGGNAEELIAGKTGNWFSPGLSLTDIGGTHQGFERLAILGYAGIFKASEMRELINWYAEKIYLQANTIYYYTFYKGGFGNVVGPGLVKYLTMKDENMAARKRTVDKSLAILDKAKDCPNALPLKPLWSALKTYEPPQAIPRTPPGFSEAPGYPDFLKDADKKGYFAITNVLFSTAGTKGRITPLSVFGY
jgi:hypothetical protein